MASVILAGGGGACQLLRPTPLIPIKLSAVKAAAPIDFRFKKNVLRLQIRERWHVASASKSYPLGGDSIEEKSGGVKTTDAAQGPPLLTIQAGFLVLLLLFWVLGSVLMWLISLFVSVPPSK